MIIRLGDYSELMKRTRWLRGGLVAVSLAWACVACRAPQPAGPAGGATTAPAVPAPASTRDVATTPDPEVSTAVDQVLSSATHPGLKWGKIPDVVPVLKPLYDLEPDRL